MAASGNLVIIATFSICARLSPTARQGPDQFWQGRGGLVTGGAGMDYGPGPGSARPRRKRDHHLGRRLAAQGPKARPFAGSGPIRVVASSLRPHRSSATAFCSSASSRKTRRAGRRRRDRVRPASHRGAGDHHRQGWARSCSTGSSRHARRRGPNRSAACCLAGARPQPRGQHFGRSLRPAFHQIDSPQRQDRRQPRGQNRVAPVLRLLPRALACLFGPDRAADQLRQDRDPAKAAEKGEQPVAAQILK